MMESVYLVLFCVFFSTTFGAPADVARPWDSTFNLLKIKQCPFPFKDLSLYNPEAKEDTVLGVCDSNDTVQNIGNEAAAFRAELCSNFSTLSMEVCLEKKVTTPESVSHYLDIEFKEKNVCEIMSQMPAPVESDIDYIALLRDATICRNVCDGSWEPVCKLTASTQCYLKDCLTGGRPNGSGQGNGTPPPANGSGQGNGTPPPANGNDQDNITPPPANGNGQGNITLPPANGDSGQGNGLPPTAKGNAQGNGTPAPPANGSGQGNGTPPPTKGDGQGNGLPPPANGSGQGNGTPAPPANGSGQGNGTPPPTKGDGQGNGLPPPANGSGQDSITPPPANGNGQGNGTPPPANGNDQDNITPPPASGNGQGNGTPPPANGGSGQGSGTPARPATKNNDVDSDTVNQSSTSPPTEPPSDSTPSEDWNVTDDDSPGEYWREGDPDEGEVPNQLEDEEGANKNNANPSEGEELNALGGEEGANKNNANPSEGESLDQSRTSLNTKPYDDEPSSSHFLAYFLTAVVICISGYVIYHNKQKIMAFIVEGRSNERGKRQRSKDVKYTQLKSNVEEVIPSLEKTATAKNYVY